MKTKGFALIELLIVIAIIAILAAILFPAFARARENARRSSCQSNLKQLGLGMMQYTQDYDERFPIGVPSTLGTGAGWGGQIYPYLKSSEIFLCPSYRPSALVTFPVTPPEVRVSYALNTSISSRQSGIGIASVLSALTAPTKTVLLLEVHANAKATFNGINGQEPTGTHNSVYCTPATNGHVGRMWRNASDATNDAGAFMTGCTGRRYGTNNCKQGEGGAVFNGATGVHLSGANYLLADGHVKWYNGDNVSTGYAAVTSTTAQTTSTNCDSTPCRAEGTGVGTFQITFSTL